MLAALVALGTVLAVPARVDAQIKFEVFDNKFGSARSPWTPTLKVIRSEEELQALWSSLGRYVAPPDVDFRSHVVIAYFLGLRPTGGYRLEAERVEIRAGTMTVHLIEVTPGECCGTAQTATLPEIMISTIPWKGPVSVEVRREPRSCCMQ